jgi:N-acetylglutamate synthase-like GNAT family acetyltransferase
MARIVTLADRPDLAPAITRWIWNEWSEHDGYSFEETLEYVSGSSAGNDIPQTFVLLVDGEPVGTSSFVAADLKERPGLTPWMASVFVIPEARRRGHVIRLIQAVEAAAVAASVPALWLHTDTAERIYAKAGWQTVEIVQREGKKPANLMRRIFEIAGCSQHEPAGANSIATVS